MKNDWTKEHSDNARVGLRFVSNGVCIPDSCKEYGALSLAVAIADATISRNMPTPPAPAETELSLEPGDALVWPEGAENLISEVNHDRTLARVNSDDGLDGWIGMEVLRSMYKRGGFTIRKSPKPQESVTAEFEWRQSSGSGFPMWTEVVGNRVLGEVADKELGHTPTLWLTIHPSNPTAHIEALELRVAEVEEKCERLERDRSVTM